MVTSGNFSMTEICFPLQKTWLSCLSASHPIAGLVVYRLLPKYKNGSGEIFFVFFIEKQGISRDDLLLSHCSTSCLLKIAFFKHFTY